MSASRGTARTLKKKSPAKRADAPQEKKRMARSDRAASRAAARPVEKTLIAVLVSHDHPAKNEELVSVLNRVCAHPEFFDHFHFLFTGGTFDRIVLGNAMPVGAKHVIKVSDNVREALLRNSTVLPSFADGGIIVLTYLVCRRVVSLVWSFLTPLTSHWLNPEDLALIRLCDVWRAKRLMNKGSVLEWLEREASFDANRNLQEIPISFELPRLGIKLRADHGGGGQGRLDLEVITSQLKKRPKKLPRTIALIAHDKMKPRMVEFAVDHESELRRFGRVLTTGTTGRLILDSTTELEGKLHRYHSGPIGGDVEIAAEILFGLCDVVLFFVDPLNPHPHIDDIRVVFCACMRKEDVRMMANETHAREWIERVLRV